MDGQRANLRMVLPVISLAAAAGCSLVDLPEIHVSPQFIDLGAMEVGTDHSATITVTNVGGSSLELYSVDFIGSARYTISAPATPLALERDQEVEIDVGLTALEGLTYAGETVLTSNDVQAEVVAVELTAVGLGPALIRR